MALTPEERTHFDAYAMCTHVRNPKMNAVRLHASGRRVPMSEVQLSTYGEYKHIRRLYGISEFGDGSDQSHRYFE